MTSVHDERGSAGAGERDEDQVRALIGERARAVEAKDADRLVACYAPEIVLFDLEPPLQHSADEVLDPSGARAWFGTWEDDMAYAVHGLTVVVGGEVAFAHGLVRLSGTSRGATETTALWFRTTLCLRKLEGVWLISHEHDSTPFYMDGSLRAAVDLQPGP
jgi:ketosteroid isomerase-like protein